MENQERPFVEDPPGYQELYARLRELYHAPTDEEINAAKDQTPELTPDQALDAIAAQLPKPDIVVLALIGNTKATIRSNPQMRKIAKRVKVRIADTQARALHFLRESSPRQPRMAVLVADMGVARSDFNSVRHALYAYIRKGGIAVCMNGFAWTVEAADLDSFFGDAGLPWRDLRPERQLFAA
ncbi:hypothetical protein VTI74DRAFT_5955 [Chaetomium olivicolor]